MRYPWLAWVAVSGVLATVGASATSLSPHPEDPGVGPVKNVEPGPIDPALVKQGEGLFDRKCTMCHALDERRVGPALRDVTKTRAPEFIMNMLLNSSNMEKDDPAVRKLMDEYHVPMPDQQLDREQARAILEYLRSVASSGR